MKALPKGTPVRVKAPDIVGEIVSTEANGDDFGYRVKWVGEDDQNHERFFPAEEIETVAPIVTPLSISLSGTKGTCSEQVAKACGNAGMQRALISFLHSLPGDSFSGTVSISTDGAGKGASVSVSGSAFTTTPIEEKE